MKFSSEAFNLNLAISAKNQNDIAVATGLSQAVISKAARGLSIRTKTAGMIANALKVDVKELLKEKE